jgi:hypothetical protein
MGYHVQEDEGAEFNVEFNKQSVIILLEHAVEIHVLLAQLLTLFSIGRESLCRSHLLPVGYEFRCSKTIRLINIVSMSEM